MQFFQRLIEIRQGIMLLLPVEFRFFFFGGGGGGGGAQAGNCMELAYSEAL